METHLDNPFWHMLSHNLAEYTTGTTLVKRCDPEFLPIAALENHSDTAHEEFAGLYNTGEMVTLFEANPPQEIPGFEVVGRFTGHQLICRRRIPVPETEVDIIELSQSDIPEMAQLVELTEPGPFFPELMKMRRSFGIREDGELVAMACVRFRLPGYSEISAVCTHPDWRGKGYARLLCITVADMIWERGETPFLHVAPNNTPAYRIYTALDFVKRGEITGVTLSRA